MRVHGLRLRIAALVTAVVLVCVGVAFVAVYRQTSSQLSRRATQDLRTDMAALAQVVSTGSQRPDAIAARARRFLGHEPFHPTNHIVYVAPVGASAVSNEPELLGLAVPESGESSSAQGEENRAARAFLDAPVGASTLELPDAGHFGVLVREVRAGGRVVARLAVGEPTAATDRAKDVVLKAFLLAGALATLAALLGGVIVASRVAAPLRRMAGVASRVDGGDLGPRMAIRNRRDEVGVLAESFDHMLDRLQDAFDRQSAFVADASHELRTPLTVIRGQLEVLALADDPDHDEIRRVERLVRTEIARMDRLVDDLLLLAQADGAGFLRLRTISLSDFLGDLVRGLADTAPRRLTLGDVPAIEIEADEDRLAQALRNLLANALAHTTDDGRIRLEAHRDGSRLRFIVDDDGPGIPAAQRAVVFDRFHRLDPGRSRAEGGVGLGLSIVRAIAQAHGGRAFADTSPWGGARMVIEIPLRAVPVVSGGR
ncbi:MAG: two-component system, OmpR family, sensor kinase [Solirubrobacteraceae bacterium]|nr:two-component system, OmpR family, sensor kinase [Solirubrobacteraceae bacterium]